MIAAAGSAEQFDGIPDEAIQFLLQLQAEQSRTWFKAHQSEFTRFCRQPLERFVGELRERLLDVYPGLLEVEPHLFRIQRDTRFSKDKAPYKTNLAANLPIRREAEGEAEHGIPGLYVSFGLDGEYVGVGTWHMQPDVLLKYRGMLDDPRRGARFQRLVDDLLVQGCTIATFEKLKRVPAPYPPDHPRAELLKHKGVAVMAQPAPNLSGTRGFLDWTEAQMRAAAPLVHLLDKSLGRH